MACVDKAGYVESKLKARKMRRPLCGVNQPLQVAVERAKPVRSIMQNAGELRILPYRNLGRDSCKRRTRRHATGPGVNQGKIVSPWLY
jgi:hypothetical protein